MKPRPLPDFVIIGAQKAGSTGLMRHLAAHPQVFLPDGETRYFRDPWYHFERPTVLADAVAPAGPDVLRRGIKCPDYLAMPDGPQRIADGLGDEVRFLAVLREPVSRAVSSYFWAMQWGLIPLAPVEAGLARDPLRGAAAHSPARAGGARLRPLRRAPVALVLGRPALAAARPGGRRAARRARAATMRSVFEFLGVDPSRAPAWDGRAVNAGVYSMTRLRVLARRHRFLLRTYPGFPGSYLRPAPPGLPRLADRSIAALDRLVLSRVCDNTKPSISAELRARAWRPTTATTSPSPSRCSAGRWGGRDGRGRVGPARAVGLRARRRAPRAVAEPAVTIYVAGTMRSGTTIAGQLLASSPSTVLVGEVKPVLLEPERHEECDCGRPRAECPFWTQVYAGADPAALVREIGSAWSLSTFPRVLLALARRKPLPSDVGRVVTFLQAIRAAAGPSTVIDTSKTPVGILLWRLAGERVDVAHCVRGVLEVARAQARPAAQSGVPQEPVLKSIAVWAVYNALIVALRPLAASYRLITFGRLRRSPRRTADAVWSAAGVQPGRGAGPTFDYEQSHVLAGNPRREKGHSVTITAR